MGLRVGVALIAVLVLGWVGVLIRDQHVGDDAAVRALTPGVDPADRRSDLPKLRDAQLLNPDPAAKVAEASTYAWLGDNRTAAALAEDLVRAEPDSIATWAILAQATRRSDPRRAATARRRIRQLNPLIREELVR